MTDEGKVTIFVTSGPETPQRCATPFYMANIAAAMDNEAEMIFQIDGVLLMKKGVAENLFAKEGGKSIMDFIRDANEADVEMKVCSAALQLHDMTEDDLIEELFESVHTNSNGVADFSLQLPMNSGTVNVISRMQNYIPDESFFIISNDLHLCWCCLMVSLWN